MIRDAVRFVVFLGMAVAIHALILFWRQPGPSRKPLPAIPLDIQAQPRKQQSISVKLLPSSQEAEEQQEKPTPVRLTSNDEKLPETETPAAPKKEEAPDKKEESKQPRSSAGDEGPKKVVKETKSDLREEQDKEQNEDETRVATQRPTPNTQRPTSSEEEDLNTVIKKLSDAKKGTVRSSMTETEYRRYLESLRMGRIKGKPTPQLIHAFHDVAEILAVHRYYGMKIIALDTGNPKRVVELVGLGGEEVSFQKIDEFNWDLYSNRVFQRTASYFEELRKKIVRQGLMPKSARLYSVSPNGIDTYFRYKQLEAIKHAGYDDREVANTVARFHKTDFGGRIMAVERLQLKAGKIITVTDFELEKMTNH